MLAQWGKDSVHSAGDVPVPLLNAGPVATCNRCWEERVQEGAGAQTLLRAELGNPGAYSSAEVQEPLFLQGRPPQ